MENKFIFDLEQQLNNNIDIDSMKFDGIIQLKIWQKKMFSLIDKIYSIRLNEIVRLIEDYIKRAEQIKANLRSQPKRSLHLKDISEKGIERARYLIAQALDQDEQKQYEAAFKLYEEAIALCINEKKTNDNIKIKEQLDKYIRQGIK